MPCSSSEYCPLFVKPSNSYQVTLECTYLPTSCTVCSIRCTAFRQVHCVPSGALRSVRCTAFRQVHCVPSGALRSVRCTAFRQVHCVPSGALRSVRCTAFRQVHCVPSGALRSVRCTVFHQVHCVPSGVLCVYYKVCYVCRLLLMTAYHWEMMVNYCVHFLKMKTSFGSV